MNFFRAISYGLRTARGPKFSLAIPRSTLKNVTACLAGGGLVSLYTAGSTVSQGVSVDGVELGGLSEEEARHTILQMARNKQGEVVAIHAGSSAIPIALGTLGELSTDRVTELTLAQGGREPLFTRRLVSRVSRSQNNLHLSSSGLKKGAVEAVAARLPTHAAVRARFGPGNPPTVIAGSPGLRISRTALADALKMALVTNEREVWIPDAEYCPPQWPSAQKLKRFKVLVARHTTTIRTKSSDSIANMTRAAQELNGVVIGANGGQFSFNGILGERTEIKGYRAAKALNGSGKVVLELGGGVCQASTTVFLTLTKAGFLVVERSCHSGKVSYAGGPGFDATVSFPTHDLKLNNTTGQDVALRVYVQDGQMIAEAWAAAKASVYVLAPARLPDGHPTIARRLATGGPFETLPAHYAR